MAILRVQQEENTHIDFDLEHGRTSIGRHSENDIIFNDASVSNHHARLNYEQYYFLTDLRSSNGTFINGKKVFHVKLADGDVINFAGTHATFYE